MGTPPSSPEPDETTAAASGRSAPEAVAAAARAPGGASVQQAKAEAELPSLGFMGWLRFLWRQLTSMQTALFLLLLLAIGALPGSYFPQRNQDPSKTTAYLESHGDWATWLDKIGFFDVYSSPWFSAIYLLLFASLIGCVVPRAIHHFKSVRSRPPRTPSRLARFAHYRRWELDADRVAAAGGFEGDAFTAAASAALRKRRYRVDRHERVTPHGTEYSVSAERGYLRETGNLVFHLALVGVLCSIAFGYLFSYKGQVIIVEGEGFSNNIANYDSFSPGPWVDTSTLPNFQIVLNALHVAYEQQDVYKLGEARSFDADLTVSLPGQNSFQQNVLVNNPLRLDGVNAYLLGNGYALDVTYTDGSGHVFESQTVSVPLDANYTSNYVNKQPDASPSSIALTGLFMPTGTLETMPPQSQYPDLLNPLLLLTAYTGDLSEESGQPSNVYLVDTSKLDSVLAANGDIARFAMTPGQTITLPNGLGTVTFNGAKRYAAFDIKYDPAGQAALIFMFVSIAGLITSIFVPRRRMWFKVVPLAGGAFALEAAALARSEDPSLETALDDMAERLGLGVGAIGLMGVADGMDNKSNAQTRGEADGAGPSKEQ
ncbi:cytochrome c biogenesis protein ResB [Micrococcales bacterium 31B]|nr:cytochrome c biogenesis protein ResB [Micrococcales bacterium 31B]